MSKLVGCHKNQDYILILLLSIIECAVFNVLFFLNLLGGAYVGPEEGEQSP